MVRAHCRWQYQCSEQFAETRIGLVTADSRAYALAAGVRLPLLRFAIINANGVVLFHSDDSRSLSENLLVETEQNASLSEATRKRVAPLTLDRVAVRDHFDGLYVGEPHRFYYRPAAGLPVGRRRVLRDRELG